MIKEEFKRDKEIPEYKVKQINELVEKIGKSRTLLVASIKNLPGSQFHKIKKSLREKAEVGVYKKTAVLRAIDDIDKGAIKNLKKKIGSDVAILFSDIDPFELSGLLSDNVSAAKAKMGDIAPEDIVIEPGPTELIPGPAISELGAVGLKVAVENGKLSIKKKHTLVKKGEEINSKVSDVMGKLDILPMKVGFEPIAAYDSTEDKVFEDIKIDKEGTLERLREMISKGLGFAVNVGYFTKETIRYFISKAGAEERALTKLESKKEGEKLDEECKNGEQKEKIEKDEKEEETTRDEKSDLNNVEKKVKEESNNQKEEQS
jgi:large subunit ribosomal protein L10